EPLPPLAKLLGVDPIGTSNDVTPPADLIQTSTVPDNTKLLIIKESFVKTIKKKAQTKSPSVPDPSPDKKADSSTKQLLLTLMREAMYKLKAQTSHATSSRKALKIPKPFIPCKYCGFNDHHSYECEYYPICDICGSIAHEPADCDKKIHSNNRKPRIANQQSSEPTKKWVYKRN
nr:hypothetical protein [Tanacetum cinerariifolium]